MDDDQFYVQKFIAALYERKNVNQKPKMKKVDSGSHVLHLFTCQFHQTPLTGGLGRAGAAGLKVLDSQRGPCRRGPGRKVEEVKPNYEMPLTLDLEE